MLHYLSLGCRSSLRLLAALAAMGTLGVAALPARASIPGMASGTGLATYNITSTGWAMGALEVLDAEGNYTQAGIAYPSVTATVNWGDAVKSRSGTINYRQDFVWEGESPPGDLSYTQTVKAFAHIDRIGETASGTSDSGCYFGDAYAHNDVSAAAPSSDPNDPQDDEQIHTATITVTNPTSDTWFETATVTANATTPQ